MLKMTGVHGSLVLSHKDGALIRDHRGSCLAACSEYLAEVTRLELAEALALHRAIHFAKDEGFDRVVMASNCLSVIQCVTSVTDRSILRTVTEDIKLLAPLFSSYVFQHVFRGANVPAHSLARLCEDSSFAWRGAAWLCIQEHICNDIMVM
jgi:hypothetical protein